MLLVGTMELKMLIWYITNMITVWVNKNSLEFFMDIINNLNQHDQIICDYKTYPPKIKQKYVQMLITYDEFVHLEDKSVVQ